MIKIKQIDERLYDPELGEGVSSTQIARKYLSKSDVKDYYISFTEINKIGINPQSKYETPLGIYAYPLIEFFDVYKPKDNYKLGLFAPFAGESAYVNIIKVDQFMMGRFIDDISTTYTDKDLENDINWLLENKQREVVSSGSIIGKIFQKNLKAENIPSHDWEQHYERLGKEALYLVGENARYNHFPGGQFWNITRLIAKASKGKPSVQWNKLFRDMGYIGVADKSGIGIIHPSESFQAVFFFRGAFDLIERVENVASSKGYSELAKTKLAEELTTYLKMYVESNDMVPELKESLKSALRKTKGEYNDVSDYSLGKVFPAAFEIAYRKKLNDLEDFWEGKPGGQSGNLIKLLVFTVELLESLVSKDFADGWNSEVYETKSPFSMPVLRPMKNYDRSDYYLKV